VIRIVGGVASGRRLATPPGRSTRPTADRTREALFSSIEAMRPITGMRVLDLYAGSGAVGLEALSRGAAAVLLVDSDPRVAAVLRANAADLGLPGAEVTGARVADLLARPATQPFDLLFADPPYALAAVELTSALRAAAAGGWVGPDAIVVVERATRDPAWSWPPGFVELRSRRYGEATLWYATHPPADPGGP
jgi:16S rRNA (guanine966-N2)-methyltransferase